MTTTLGDYLILNIHNQWKDITDSFNDIVNAVYIELNIPLGYYRKYGVKLINNTSLNLCKFDFYKIDHIVKRMDLFDEDALLPLDLNVLLNDFKEHTDNKNLIPFIETKIRLLKLKSI